MVDSSRSTVISSGRSELREGEIYALVLPVLGLGSKAAVQKLL